MPYFLVLIKSVVTEASGDYPVSGILAGRVVCGGGANVESSGDSRGNPLGGF